jgi:hypothetical protein
MNEEIPKQYIAKMNQSELERRMKEDSKKKKIINTPKTKLIESELKLPIWSIVAAENVLAMNLTYYQAEQKLMHISDNGATITTNETAQRYLDKTPVTLLNGKPINDK